MKRQVKKTLILSLLGVASIGGLSVASSFSRSNNLVNQKERKHTASLVIHEHSLKEGDEVIFVNTSHDNTLSLRNNVSSKVNLGYVDPTTLSFPVDYVESFEVTKLASATFAFKNENNFYLAADSFSFGLTTETEVTSQSRWEVSIDNDYVATLKLDNDATDASTDNPQYLTYRNEYARFFLTTADTISNVQIYKLNNEEVTLELINLPYRVNYRIGETLEPAGLEVKLRYPDGTVRPDYQDYTITYPDDTFSSLGMKYITVTSNEYASAMVQFTIELCDPGNAIYDMYFDDYDFASRKNKTVSYGDYSESPHVVRDNNGYEWILNAGQRSYGTTTLGATEGYEQFLAPKGAFMYLNQFKRSNHLMAIAAMRDFSVTGAKGVEFHFATPTGYAEPLYANIAYTNDFGKSWNMALTRDVDVRGLSKICYSVPSSVNNNNIGFAVYFEYPTAFTIENLSVKMFGASTSETMVDPEFIEISAHDNVFLEEGDTLLLSGGIFPLNNNLDIYHKNTLDWIMSDPTIASIDNDTGLVTALSPGTTTLTMQVHKDRSYSDTINIHVEAKPTGISISPDSKHQTTFPLHTEFNYDGLIVLKDYDNGYQEIRDHNFSVTPISTHELGTFDVIVTDNVHGFTTSYPVTITAVGADITPEDVGISAVEAAKSFLRATGPYCEDCEDNSNAANWDAIIEEYNVLPDAVKDYIFTGTEPEIQEMLARYRILRNKNAVTPIDGFQDFLVDSNNVPLSGLNVLQHVNIFSSDANLPTVTMTLGFFGLATGGAYFILKKKFI